MNDQQKKEQYSGVQDQKIRAALDQHWTGSDASDFETEHRIYHEDAVLEYPQSGERTRGRSHHLFHDIRAVTRKQLDQGIGQYFGRGSGFGSLARTGGLPTKQPGIAALHIEDVRTGVAEIEAGVLP